MSNEASFFFSSSKFRKLRIEEEDEVGTETMDFNPPRFRLEAGALIIYF